jgi:hypothetical protein
MVLEDTPRLTMTDLRRSPSWKHITAAGCVDAVIDVGGTPTTFRIELDYDDATFGRRPWLRCPSCGSRRINLFLHDGTVGCQTCHHLLYREQAMARCAWKLDVVIPALRAARRLRKEIDSGTNRS